MSELGKSQSKLKNPSIYCKNKLVGLVIFYINGTKLQTDANIFNLFEKIYWAPLRWFK